MSRPLDNGPAYEFEWGVNIIRVQGATRTDIVFSHENPEIQTVNITRILAAIANQNLKPKRIQAVLHGNESIKAMLRDRDIDQARVAEILADKVLYNSPVIFAGRIPDVTLIDGTHRICARVSQREESVRAYVIAMGELKRFRVNFWVNGKFVEDTRESVLRTYEHPKVVIP